MTFKLEQNNIDELDSGKRHHSNCYHHYIDEPTKVIELEPQPNNVNKVKWKSPANTIYRTSESAEVSSVSERPEKQDKPEIVSGSTVPDPRSRSSCYHACRLCVPNYPPLPGFDPAITGHSALNLRLNDITDRFIFYHFQHFGTQINTIFTMSLSNSLPLLINSV